MKLHYHTEADVQVVVFNELRKRYKDVRLQLPYKGNSRRESRKHKIVNVIPDVSVLNEEGKPLFVIEVKAEPTGTSLNQIRHYAEVTKVMCIRIQGMEQAKNTLEIIDEALSSGLDTIEFDKRQQKKYNIVPYKYKYWKHTELGELE